MLGFLRNIWNAITSDITAVYHWVLKTIAAVYSYFDRLINAVEKWTIDLVDNVENFAKQILSFAESVYNFARAIVTVTIRDLINWAAEAIDTLTKYAEDVYNFVVQWIARIIAYIQHTVSDVISWIMKNIWDPLWRDITGAINWITHEGAFIYDLITHPDKLVALLAHYLWVSYLDLIKKFAAPIAKWLLHSMESMAGEFADVLEKIIAAML